MENIAFQNAGISSNHCILEIGFGNGKLLERLCKTVANGRIYGADISQDLIDQATSKLQFFIKEEKLELHLAGISKLALPNNSVDRIITCNTIYFWPEPLADAKELLRVLKPTGRLIIGYRTTDEMAEYPFVTQNPDIFKNQLLDQEVKQLLLDAGFKDVVTIVEPSELVPSHVAIGTKPSIQHS